MGYRSIQFEKYGHVGLIKLNQPQIKNAFSAEMGREWSEAYRHCESDDDIHVVVVTGNGRAFCAGADMSDGGATFDAPNAQIDNFSSCPIDPQPWNMRKLVLAAVNGHAIGLGLSLAMQCDIRIFADEGKYGFLQVRRGVISDGCSHLLLPYLVGQEKAIELLVGGRLIDGQEAIRIGLASRSLPSAEVLEQTMAMAEEFATHCSPIAMALGKQLVWRSHKKDLIAMERAESELLKGMMGSADAIEGGVAFIEKRQPVWQTNLNDSWPRWFDKELGENIHG